MESPALELSVGLKREACSTSLVLERDSRSWMEAWSLGSRRPAQSGGALGLSRLRPGEESNMPGKRERHLMGALEVGKNGYGIRAGGFIAAFCAVGLVATPVAAAGVLAPEPIMIAGIPVDFILFALTLLGVA